MAEAKKKKIKKKDGAKTVSAKKGSAAGKSLVIVESPAKQRTISRYLKKGFVVASSYGHVRDLPAKKLGVDENKEFEPTYTLLTRTKKLLPELRKAAKDAEYVYLATDHDREGESIAWHLMELLKVDASKFKRITFHEITPTAIKEAIANPREVDMRLVSAQTARRVIDRLVGYKLSPLLWKKIRRGLSAGRVQSVAVRLMVEREHEIKAFASQPYHSLFGTFEKSGQPPQFDARLTRWKGEKLESTQTFQLFAEEYRVKSTSLRKPEDVQAIVDAVRGGEFKVIEVTRKEVKRRPQPPFITSTMQQAGSQKYGFAAERTMRIAQSLYEGVDIGSDEPTGLITYMRTDSVNVAKVAQGEARGYLQKNFGDKYVPESPPVYPSKVKGAQEAHEAIRPTSVHRTPKEMRKYLTAEQIKLYTLIWKRFLSSQMCEAVFDTMSVDLESGEALFHATGRTLKFDGFLKVLSDDEEGDDAKNDADSRLPDLQEGDALKLIELKPEEHNTSPPPYYNEASLIRALERHGIGRPSTYAPTIKTIIDRGYIRRGLKDRRLMPTDLGLLVVKQLNKHFTEQMSLSYTATVEQQLDQVAEGAERWQGVVNSFYAPFAKALEVAAETMEDCRFVPVETDEECPTCGKKMLIRESRFGKYLSCGDFPKCKGKIQLDSEGQKIVPEKTDHVCEICGKPMVIRTGRKGRFLACSGYPACKNTYSLDENGNKVEGSRPLITPRLCNKCQSPMWMRLGKRGHFLACSGFPKCRNLKPLSKDNSAIIRAEAEVLEQERKLVAQQAKAEGGEQTE
ncbi:MAG: type I DNA topoisomerase [Elusimicrobiota bacterium]